MHVRRQFLGESPARLFLSLVIVVFGASTAGAQLRPAEVFVGSESEEYLRYLQSAGAISLYPWSIRGFSPREIDRLMPTDSGHPWQVERPQLTGDRSPLTVALIRPSLTTYFNSAFPFGYNDGAVWQGKGFTTALSVGIQARYGPVWLNVAPLAFMAQNAGFDLQDNGRTDTLRFAHGQLPTVIDAPQRFGDGAYTVLDPGQSTFGVDLGPVAAGASTANQHWGPAVDHPIVLGNNAAGFTHVFAGTAKPLDFWLFKVHGRAVWGDLRQSDFTLNPASLSRRYMSGVVGLVQPRGVPGLELGAGRFFHTDWPGDGLTLRDLWKPFESVLKINLPVPPGGDLERRDADNQVASAWLRWVFPRSGFELYGEWGKEDHNWDLRDLILEPDHESGYTLGFRKLWNRSPAGFWALRAEQMNLQVSQITRDRQQSQFYRHSSTRQGHTQRGQILGSDFGVGGSATTVRLERYHQTGRWSVHWNRMLRQDRGSFWRTGARVHRAWDVIHAVGGEALLNRGRWEITGGATAMLNLNRNYGPDAFNLNGWIGVRAGLGSRTMPAPETVGDGRVAPPPLLADSSGTPATDTLTARAPAFFGRVTGAAAERERTYQILGWASPDGYMLRSPSSLAAPLDGDHNTPRFSLIAPEVELVNNSRLPFSLNQGSLWAGRGRNTRLRAGFRAEWASVFLIAAPEIVHSQNGEFEMPDPRLTPVADQRANLYANPWHITPNSIDLPLRFGNESFSEVYLGQSTLGVRTGAAEFGLSTENQWWGPGIKNAILLSDNAPGFLHSFVRTGRPIKTGVGQFEGKWLIGGLRESDYFDSLNTNDVRSLSAFTVNWTPPGPFGGLTMGFSRAVYAPADGYGDAATNLFDALLRFPGRPNDVPPADSTQTPGPDQIYVFSGRWIFPESGFEAYGEWSRTEFPASVRDLLEAPGHTQGYTIGLHWARTVGRGSTGVDPVNGEQAAGSLRTGGRPSSSAQGTAGVIRIQAEHTYLEKSTTFRHRPVGTYYTSRAVVQGYTHEGRVLGAAIGPGASSHWLAIDYLAPTWQVGLFGGRIRQFNDALYDAPLLGEFYLKLCHHDVSLWGGVRAAYDGPLGKLEASLAAGQRMNLHFQHFTVCGLDANPDAITDVNNTTFELRYSVPL